MAAMSVTNGTNQEAILSARACVQHNKHSGRRLGVEVQAQRSACYQLPAHWTGEVRRHGSVHAVFCESRSSMTKAARRQTHARQLQLILQKFQGGLLRCSKTMHHAKILVITIRPVEGCHTPSSKQ